jgi:virginiamycin B lyase
MMRIKTLMFLTISFVCTASHALADTVDIREWLIPWENSEPKDTFVDSRGRVWFAGFGDHYIGIFSRETAEFNRYDLRKGTAPSALLIDSNQVIWYAGNGRRHIGMLDPGAGRTTEIGMPDRKAKEPRSMVFGPNGDIWFSVENGDFVGRLRTGSGEIDLVPVPGGKSRPFGLAVSPANELWVAASGRNALLRIDPALMKIAEVQTPNEDSRLRRIVTSSDNHVWYADYELGQLGRYQPHTGEFTEWQLPGGTESRPFGMAIDRDDRIWLVETGGIPNRLIGFDTATETFLTETDIPSGAGSVSHLFYAESLGEIWFATATNYIGRARIH